MSSYTSADSPKGANEVEQYKRNVQDTSKAIKEFNQLTVSIKQKMALFNTPQDSRVNHQQLKELAEKGNQLVAKINRRLQDLAKACQGAVGRSRKTEVNKLTNDHKNVLKAFEATCQQLLENEKTAVANIRKSSRSFRNDDEKPSGLGAYSEDQIYKQANVQNYNEDDLVRREEDIIQINHQMREVNAAFREVDDLIAAQGEVVVEIENNADDTKEHVEGALDQVRQADMRRGFCQCSKTKMLCWGFLVLIAVVVALTLVLSLKAPSASETEESTLTPATGILDNYRGRPRASISSGSTSPTPPATTSLEPGATMEGQVVEMTEAEQAAHQAQLEQQLKSFWSKQLVEMEQLEVGSEQDFKNHNDLPLARIKRIMKSDEDVRMISAEAPVLFAKACEMFILELTLRSWSYSERNKRRTLQKEDIQAAIRNTDIFDFLVDVIN